MDDAILGIVSQNVNDWLRVIGVQKEKAPVEAGADGKAAVF
jgi:hypothetical protein